jgi:5-methylcytosine-specific restriction endonuclease McrA
MSNASTLLVNSTGIPVSIIPLSSIQWTDAAKFLYTNVAEPLHFYDDWVVRSQKLEYKVPSVMILKKQIKIKRQLKCETDMNIHPSSRLLFLRDGYICQYCGDKFSPNQLTVDHVVPKKHNGKSIWTNVVSACSSCNANKGHKSIMPKNKPFIPTYSYLVKMLKKFPLYVPDVSWNYYLGWSDDLVIISPPQKNVANGSESILNDKRVKLSF